MLTAWVVVVISTLKPGTKVLVTNTRTGKTQAEPVAAVLVHYDKNLYGLKVRAAGHTSVIYTTRSHLFWNQTTHHWTKAAALQYGTHLRTPSDSPVTVLGGWTPKVTTGWMWDLTIPGNNDHDFYIQATTATVLVHNEDSSRSCGSAGGEGDASETFYRTMSKEHFQELMTTGRLPATGETFVSPSKAFSSTYEGRMVEFSVRAGTGDALAQVGVRDTSALTSAAYPDMPVLERGWAASSAFFKGEGQTINIGLGHGPALDIFNQAIEGFREVV